MKTYKLPIAIESEEDKSYILDLCRQQSIIVRSSYNDILEGKTVKELEQKYKTLNNIEQMDAWFIRCGILRGKSLTQHKKLVFGGKSSFIKVLQGKMTKEEWKSRRTYSLDVQGEVHKGGNRKFVLDLENNRILFKPKCGKKIYLSLPKIRTNWRRELECVQDLECCFSVKLSNEHIEIIVDENLFKSKNHETITGRTMGIDLNPDFIGYNITDYPSETVLVKECFETSGLNKKSGKSSSSPESKYLTNKRKHEYIEICWDLVKKCVHFGVEKLVIEELNIKNGNLGNKNVNRKNNFWLRNLISTKLKMLCNMFGIQCVEVNPAYSSIVGNLVYSDFDPVSSSREIGRRGYYKYEKGKFYPSLESVKHQWKEMVTDDIKSWKELTNKLKTQNLRYRVPLSPENVVCRHTNIKKLTNLYSFI